MPNSKPILPSDPGEGPNQDIARRKQAEQAMREAEETLEQRVAERTVALRQSEEQLRLLVDGTNDCALFMLDPKGHITTWNEGGRQLKGYGPDEVIGRHFSLFYTPEDVAAGKPARELEIAQSEGKYEEEGERVRKDGSRFWASVLITPLRDGQGRLRGFSKVTRDITGRKRADAALRGSEQRLKRSQEIAHLGSWELDLTQNRLTWSDEVYRIFGLRPQEFGATYQAFLERVHPEDRQKVDDAYSGSLRENRDTYEVEHRVIREDTGEVRTVYEKCEHFRDAAGQVLRSVGMVHDITERKRTEDAIRFIAQCGPSASGEDFFQALALYLGQSLGMDFVCIDQLEEGSLAARTLAIYFDGKFEDNVTYGLKDTPCGDVVGKTVCCFPRDVRRLFPKDAVLQQMMAESYVGVTLWGSQGQPIGLIAVLGRKPLADSRLATSILQVVAVRAAAELERRQAEEALRVSEQRYRSLFEHMLDGFAYCRMLYKNGLPQDFIYLEVNSAFERLTGLKNVVGKKVSEVIPGIQETNPELFQIYGRVALTGQPERFETWLPSLGIWFSVSVYSPRKEQFVAVFDNITERKRAQTRLTALSTLGRSLSAARTDQEAAGVIMEVADQLFGWDACKFNLYSRERNQITAVFAKDLINGQKVQCPPLAEPHEPTPLMQNIIAHGAKLVLKDSTTPLAGAVPFGNRSRPSASIMFVPVRRGSAVTGLFSIHSYTPNAYTEEDLQALQTVADYCGGALERLRAEAEMHRHAEELRARNQDLTRFNESMVGRELRMIELKQEIDELCARLGQPPRYGPVADEQAGPKA